VITRAEVRAACAALAGVTSDDPFGPDAEIYRIGGRIFALVSELDERVSLKCDPALAEILRHSFRAIVPGYHLNKRHWNTVSLDGSVPDAQVRELIQHSYDLVLASLPKKERAAIQGG